MPSLPALFDLLLVTLGATLVKSSSGLYSTDAGTAGGFVRSQREANLASTGPSLTYPTRHSAGDPVMASRDYGTEGRHDVFGPGYDAPPENFRTSHGSYPSFDTAHVKADVSRPQSSGPLSYEPGSSEYLALQEVLTAQGPGPITTGPGLPAAAQPYIEPALPRFHNTRMDSPIGEMQKPWYSSGYAPAPAAALPVPLPPQWVVGGTPPPVQPAIQEQIDRARSAPRAGPQAMAPPSAGAGGGTPTLPAYWPNWPFPPPNAPHVGAPAAGGSGGGPHMASAGGSGGYPLPPQASDHVPATSGGGAAPRPGGGKTPTRTTAMIAALSTVGGMVALLSLFTAG